MAIAHEQDGYRQVSVPWYGGLHSMGRVDFRALCPTSPLPSQDPQECGMPQSSSSVVLEKLHHHSSLGQIEDPLVFQGPGRNL